MYGPKYVWILNSARIQDNWWKVQSPLVDCTPEEVRKGLSNNIGTGELKLSPLSGPTKFGKVCNITLSQTFYTRRGLVECWKLYDMLIRLILVDIL